MSTRANGIPHLPMMSPEELLQICRKLVDPQYTNITYTEKLDGANAVFGKDESGQVYVSREKKNGSRFYAFEEIKQSDLPIAWQFELLMHAALSFDNIRTMAPGSWFECELLLENIPNVIPYNRPGSIAVLNTNRLRYADELEKTTKYQPINVRTVVPFCDRLGSKELSEAFNIRLFNNCANHRRGEIDLTAAKKNVVKSYINLFQSFESKYGIDIVEAFNIKLNVGPAATKEQRAYVRARAREYTENVGKALKNLLMAEVPTRSLYANVDSTQELFCPRIEGVVATVPEYNIRFKLVNQEVFSDLGNFVHSIPNQIVNTFIPKVPYLGTELKAVWKLQQQLNMPNHSSLYSMFLNEVGKSSAYPIANLTHASIKTSSLDLVLQKDILSSIVDKYLTVILPEVHAELVQIEDQPPTNIYGVSLTPYYSKVWQQFYRFKKYLQRIKEQNERNADNTSPTLLLRGV